MCAAFAVYLALQLRTPRTVEVDDQTPFKVAGNDAAPASFEMDPRTQDVPDESPGTGHGRAGHHTAPDA